MRVMHLGIRRIAHRITGQQHARRHIGVLAADHVLGKTADRLQRIIEAFGDDAVIDTDRGTYSQAEIQFGATKVYATFDRDRHCTPRIEGGQVVWDLQLPDAAGAQAA